MSEEERNRFHRLADKRPTYEQVEEMMVHDLLSRYGKPAPQVEATITDANGNKYKGTLYLVEEQEASKS